METKRWRHKIPWPRSDRRTVALLAIWLALFLLTGCVFLARVLYWPAYESKVDGSSAGPLSFFTKKEALRPGDNLTPGISDGTPSPTPGRLTRVVLTQAAENAFAPGGTLSETEGSPGGIIPFGSGTPLPPGFVPPTPLEARTATPGGTSGPSPTSGTVTATWFIRYFPTRTLVYLPTRTPSPTYTLRANPARTWTFTVTPTTTQTPTPTATATTSPTPTATLTSTPTTTPTITLTPTVIAFSADENGDGTLDLLVIQPDGSGQQVAAQGAQDALLCDWSPDRQRLVFESPRGVPLERQLYFIKKDGTGEQIVPGLPAGQNTQAAWSPDGEWLVFRNHNGMQADLYLVKPDGSSLAQLTNDNFEENDPAWGADSRTVYFISNREDARVEIYSLDAGTLPFAPTRLTFTLEEEAAPRASPDGSTLLFARLDGGQWEVFKAPVSDLSAPLNLTNSSANDAAPSWSADGLTILFVSDRGAGGQVDIYRMNASGGDINRITNSAAVEARPRWIP
ncbi:MAG: PD40 domain-containing protein [Anaerolineaceae bacterium]|nr:PD40 domain-containing protein [Anaerolineaceae bacterium]